MTTNQSRETSTTRQTIQAEQMALPNEEVTAVLNQIIATITALYFKTKNYHWHVSGPHFHDYHVLFDVHAEALFASIDLLAERVRSIGGSTIHSIGQVSRLQRIDDDNETDVSASKMIQRLLLDTKILAQLLREAHTVSNEFHDIATSSILENLLDEAEKRCWFLSAMAQG